MQSLKNKIGIIFFLHAQFLLAQQTTTFKGFTDLNYSVTNKKNSFALGEYDQFVQSQLTDHISFLGEAIFVVEEKDFELYVMRAIATYEVSNYFKVAIGRHHTPIGYWNTAYHHGVVIQPTINRSDPFIFDHMGGMMPTHTVGFLISGDYITKLNFGYDFMIGNGIGSTPVEDNNPQKSVTVNLHFEPVKNLKVIISGYHDFISAGTQRTHMDIGGVTPKDMTMQILNGSLMFMNPSQPFEMIAEYLNYTNKMDSVGTKTSNAFSIYSGYKIKKFTPYVRYDQITFQKGEAYFNKDDSQKFVVGIRYSFSYLAVLKLEYEKSKLEIEGNTDRVAFQFALGF
jgi:hypothetical protein